MRKSVKRGKPRKEEQKNRETRQEKGRKIGEKNILKGRTKRRRTE